VRRGCWPGERLSGGVETAPEIDKVVEEAPIRAAPRREIQVGGNDGGLEQATEVDALFLAHHIGAASVVIRESTSGQVSLSFLTRI
jgi:hypothetical protein